MVRVKLNIILIHYMYFIKILYNKKPKIQNSCEEAKKCVIEDILYVTGKCKHTIKDNFNTIQELEQNLTEKGKTELLRLVQQTTDINLYFIRQSHPRGLGDAVLM